MTASGTDDAAGIIAPTNMLRPGQLARDRDQIRRWRLIRTKSDWPRLRFAVYPKQGIRRT
jgi:hypothetical protein